jgi:hypothetical protein
MTDPGHEQAIAEARASGDPAKIEAAYRAAYPEAGDGPPGVLLAERPAASSARPPAAEPPSPALARRQRLDEIRATLAQPFVLGSVRTALEAELEAIYRGLPVSDEAPASGDDRVDAPRGSEDEPSPDEPVDVELTWPDAPEGHEWNEAVVEATVAQLTDRGVAPERVARWRDRGLALLAAPSDARPALPDDFPDDVLAAARFALEAYLPERPLRTEVTRWLAQTGLAGDPEFVQWLGALGAPLLQERAQADAELARLEQLNPGSPAYVAAAERRLARYQRVYGS